MSPPPPQWTFASLGQRGKKLTLGPTRFFSQSFLYHLACQVFHNGLPEYLSEELEKIQRRALRIIFPDLGYQEALKECNITTLHQRRQWLTERLFNEIKDNSLHKLHGLLPPRNLSTVALRRKRAFNVPLCRTNRLMNSFIMHNAAIF